MVEDSTLHHVYNTLWALPCTVLSRSWSILRDLGRAGSDLGSVSHDSTLTAFVARRGRKQVNKALHTCMSWYAYAAMFGSSIDTMVPQALERMYRLH